MKFLVYSPEQASLLPPTVREVLGGDHLCFFLSRMVKKLDLSAFEQAYSEEGQPGYHPALLVAVWLYATALGVTSSRRLEQRVREDLAFRDLAGGAQPDHWTLNEFRRRHRRAINDLFTQVLEVARDAGLGRLGTWRLIPRGWRPTPRGTAWRARTRCVASEPSCDAKCGAGSSNATRPTRTKPRGRSSIPRRSRRSRRGWPRFPADWRSCARRGSGSAP